MRAKALRLCVTTATPNTPRTGQMDTLADTEKVLAVRDDWLSRGSTPFFFFRETVKLLLSGSPHLNSAAPKDPVSQDAGRRSAIMIGKTSTRSPINAHRVHSYEDDDGTINIIGTHSLSDSEDESMDSPSPATPVSPVEPASPLDSSTWSIENGGSRAASAPLPRVSWLKPTDIHKIHKVGDGSYAKVYKAKYADNIVAVKVLKGTPTSEQIDSFKRECELLSLINCPYLIHFFGASVDETTSSNSLSIVVEYCEKGTLHKALNSKKIDIDWQSCFRWIYQAINGVLYLHNMNPVTVHRDIKSLNLLLDAKWNVKVADFGLSRSLTHTNQASLTTLKGTMAYCAPEMQGGNHYYTVKSDVFSLAIVVWEIITRCLAGRYCAPYSDHTDIYYDYQIITMAATKGIRPTLHPRTPESLKELMEQGWDGDPQKRYTCDEMLLQVQSIYVIYKANKQLWETLREH